jgi:hypothetical protein
VLSHQLPEPTREDIRSILVAPTGGKDIVAAKCRQPGTFSLRNCAVIGEPGADLSMESFRVSADRHRPRDSDTSGLASLGRTQRGYRLFWGKCMNERLIENCSAAFCRSPELLIFSTRLIPVGKPARGQ